MILDQNKRTKQLAKRDDKEAQMKRHLRRRSWFTAELSRQAANRYQMQMDCDYYDGDQWTPQEAAEVIDRGQNPVVFNEIKPVIDFLIGTERRARVDFNVTNRTDSSEEAYKDARNKTELLKFIDDLNRTQFVRSEAADDMWKAGLGWLEVGVRADPEQFAIYKRAESWKNMLYDSLGQSKMPDGWRYLFRYREVDLDIAEAMVPKKDHHLLHKAIINADTKGYMDWWNGQPLTGMHSLIDQSLTGKWTSYDADAWLSNPRERVLLIECWADEPYRDVGDARSGLDNAPFSMRKRVAIMTEHDTLMESWSPYAHNCYPFIPLWCYRRKKDGAPYGIARQHRGPQDSLNKHMSKAQFRISTRQVLLERGALDDDVMDQQQLEETISDPSAVLTFANGALSGGKIEIKEGLQLAQADIQLAERMAMSIRSSSGVSTEDRGQDPGNVSGKARAIREAQGSKLTAEPFDNLLMARQLEGELTLSLAEQYQTEPLEFAPPGEGRRRQFVKINQPDPANPGSRLNDITKRKAAFIIGEAPWQQSLAEGAFESAMEMLGQLASVAPQVVVSILDIVFDMNPNLPRKHEMLRRIRSVTGMDDPDEGETPEAQAKKQQQAQMAQMQFEAQMAQVKADIREAQAKGEKLEADAMAKRLESLYMSAQAAQILTMAPQIAPVADELARSVGFKDQAGDGALNAPVAVQQPQQPQQQPGMAAALPELQQADGATAGIESPDITGVQQPMNPQPE